MFRKVKENKDLKETPNGCIFEKVCASVQSLFYAYLKEFPLKMIEATWWKVSYSRGLNLRDGQDEQDFKVWQPSLRDVLETDTDVCLLAGIVLQQMDEADKYSLMYY